MIILIRFYLFIYLFILCHLFIYFYLFIHFFFFLLWKKRGKKQKIPDPNLQQKNVPNIKDVKGRNQINGKHIKYASRILNARIIKCLAVRESDTTKRTLEMKRSGSEASLQVLRIKCWSRVDKDHHQTTQNINGFFSTLFNVSDHLSIFYPL